MNMMLQRFRNLMIILLFLFPVVLFAQNDIEGMVKYTPDFKFAEGIFPNFQTVQSNSPIPKTRIVTDIDLFSRDFYQQLTEEKEIVFYDDNAVKQEIKSSAIWGYSRNGVLYVNLGAKFHRISFVGSICHFVATLTSYNNSYYDQPYYNNPYYYNNYYRSPSSNYATTEVLQYLIDFETGKLYEFEVKSIEILLMKDPELYEEYMALKRKKKKQYKFVYLRRYNEKHPLYFPNNKM